MANYIDELTRFLISENKNIENLNIFEIYNRWAVSSKNKIKEESDVKRCLNLIKRREVLNNKNLTNIFTVFQED